MRLILFAAPREGIVIHDADAIHNAPLISMPEADACRALLAHEALLGALVDLLEKAEECDEELTGPADRQFFSPSLMAKARAALKLAKGE